MIACGSSRARWQPTLADAPIEQLALLRIGAGSGDARRVLEASLDRLYDRRPPRRWMTSTADRLPSKPTWMPSGRPRASTAPLEPVDAVGRRLAPPRGRRRGQAAPPRPVERPALPLAPEAPGDAVDLTVVVVFYNMRREAARTLQSLSRQYQEELGDTTYEVIVVENGSDDDQKLGAEFVAGFGPEFRLPRPGRRTPSLRPSWRSTVASGPGEAMPSP